MQANQKKNTSEVPTIQPTNGSSSDNSQPEVASTALPIQSAPEVKQSRHDLLRGFQAVIKVQEEHGVATAVGCKVRWESQPGRQSVAVTADSETGTAGNSANAQQVAANEAKKVCFYY